jgi:hypothetical protein
VDSTLDIISGLAVGTYILVVAVRGNSEQLIQLAEADKAFLKWGIAVGILVYLRSIPDLHESVSLLIAATFIGLFMMAGPSIVQGAQTFWASLGASGSENTGASATSTPDDLISSFTG